MMDGTHDPQSDTNEPVNEPAEQKGPDTALPPLPVAHADQAGQPEPEKQQPGVTEQSAVTPPFGGETPPAEILGAPLDYPPPPSPFAHEPYPFVVTPQSEGASAEEQPAPPVSPSQPYPPAGYLPPVAPQPPYPLPMYPPPAGYGAPGQPQGPYQRPGYAPVPPWSPGYGQMPPPGTPMAAMPGTAPRASGAAIAVEAILAFFGIYGVGWLMAGETTIGVVLLAGSVVWWALAVVVTVFTVGIGLICIAPLNIIFLVLSTVLLAQHRPRYR